MIDVPATHHPPPAGTPAETPLGRVSPNAAQGGGPVTAYLLKRLRRCLDERARQLRDAALDRGRPIE